MSTDTATQFKAEVLAALASGAKAPIDQRPPAGAVPPRNAPVNEVPPDERRRRSTPVDANPDTVTEEMYPHLEETHRDLIRAGLKPLFETENEIHEVRGEEQRIKVAAKALKASERAVAKANDALARLHAVAGHYDEVIRKEIVGGLNPNEAAELRAFVREQRTPFEFVTMNILKGDQRLARAVLGGAPYLSGLKAENMQVIHDTAAERFTPKEFRAHRDAMKGVQRLVNSTGSFERGITPRLQRWKKAADDRAARDRAFSSGAA